MAAMPLGKEEENDVKYTHHHLILFIDMNPFHVFYASHIDVCEMH